MALSPAQLRRWDRVHTWSSLVCTLFLLLLCLTGLPLIFHDEIDAAFAPPRAAPSAGPAQTVDALVRSVLSTRPGRFVQFVYWDDEAPHALGVGLAAQPDAALEEVQRVMVDVADAHEVPLPSPAHGLMDTLLDLHRSLLLGLPGELLLALVALCFIASAVSGIVLYAPFLRRRAFGSVRAAPRPRWLDLHNLAGIALAAWLLVVSATGLMNALEAPLFGAWNAALMPRLLAPYAGRPVPPVLSSPQRAVDTARAAHPDMRPTSIGFPYSRFGSPRHYLVWLRGTGPLGSRLFSPVLIDAASGALVSDDGLPWYLRVLETSRPLHFGDYAGLPLKLLWALFDLITIVILGSGLYLWLARRGDRARRASSAGIESEIVP